MESRLRVTTRSLNPSLSLESCQLPVQDSIRLALNFNRRTSVRYGRPVPPEEFTQPLLGAAEQYVAQIHGHLARV